MEASLIIPFYKDLLALELILLALNKQSAKGRFEVIIAEDDNALATKDFIRRISATLSFPIQHTVQEDIGYRRAMALNNGIKIAKSDYIIFIDGDCIPHKHFIDQYIKEKEKNKVLYGRRVNLSQSFSEKLRQTKNLKMLNILNLLFSKSTRVMEGLYMPLYPEKLKSKRQLWGCNMGALKEDLIRVNGFDEDYAEYGPEDLDICIRLNKIGCELKSVKFKAILYHLFHKTKALPDVMARGKAMFDEKMKRDNTFCKNGIEKN